MEILFFLILVLLFYFNWKQTNKIKKLKDQLKKYHSEKILPIELIIQRLRGEITEIAKESLNDEQIKKIDNATAARIKEFLKEKEDPLSEIYEKEWFL